MDVEEFDGWVVSYKEVKMEVPAQKVPVPAGKKYVGSIHWHFAKFGTVHG